MDQEESRRAASADMFSPGEKFRGCVVERLLGVGGLGSVYLVRHEVLNIPFALKILSPAVARESPEYVKRFVREAKIDSKIRHPNLVAVHDAGFDDAKGVYFLVMDYVEGGDLRMAIAMGGPMEHHEAVRIAASVASALAAGDRLGVVHRDIKPENIMLKPDGTVKLVDLGVAKINGADSLHTAANAVFGTPSYISPEQAVDSGSVDIRADVYSLGIVLFEMLCGRRPYGGNVSETLKFLLSPAPVPEPRSVNPRVPQDLSALVRLMCEKDVSKRLASPAAFLDALKRLGYEVPAADVAEYTRSSPVAAPLDMAALPAAPTGGPDPLETKDVEISEFLMRSRARRRRRRIVRILSAWLALAAALSLVAFFVARFFAAF